MSFKDIKGQEKALQQIEKQMRACACGAYLFEGPQGVGKFLAAMATAKALNCQLVSPGSFDSCGSCPSCQKIIKGNHPDIHVLDCAQEQIKIESIRELQERITLRPYEARVRVFIINNAHSLTPEAANAFLKTLEEPPQDSLIILVSPKPELVMDTIISRCKRIRFGALQENLLEDILAADYSIDGKIAHFLANYCEGRIGRALELSQRDIIAEKNAVLDAFLYPRARNDFPDTQRQSLKESFNILFSWFRDVYMIKSGSAEGRLINLDRYQELEELAGKYSFGRLNAIMDLICDSIRNIDYNVNVKLLVSNIRSALNGAVNDGEITSDQAQGFRAGFPV